MSWVEKFKMSSLFLLIGVIWFTLLAISAFLVIFIAPIDIVIFNNRTGFVYNFNITGNDSYIDSINVDSLFELFKEALHPKKITYRIIIHFSLLLLYY